MEFEGQVVSCTMRKTERGGQERSKPIKTFGGVDSLHRFLCKLVPGDKIMLTRFKGIKESEILKGMLPVA